MHTSGAEESQLRVVPVDLTAGPADLFLRLGGLPGLAFLDTAAPAGRTGSEGWSLLTALPTETLINALPPMVVGRPGTPRADHLVADGLRDAIARRNGVSGNGLRGNNARRDGNAESGLELADVPFLTGWLGYASYEAASMWNSDLVHQPPDPSLPRTWWGRYAASLVHRHRDQQWFLAHRRDDEGARAAGELLAHALDPERANSAQRPRVSRISGWTPEDPSTSHDHVSRADRPSFSTGLPRAGLPAGEYARRVREILRWIERGHIYQANLTYPVRAPFSGSAEALFLALRTHNAAPFGAYLAPEPFLAILSSSPELFLRTRGSEIETRPIKGTSRRNLGDPYDDRQLARALFTSPKDRAELTMIVDLERNDLGRLCRPGSVRTLPFPRLESYRRVHHLAATVRGELARPLTLETLLGTTFPGGSVTGAPKIRAMEILRDLEIAPRWVYTGALGSIDERGHVDLSLTIRTMWARRGEVTFHVGGGIVADSSAESEWEETLHKAQGMLDALSAGGSISALTNRPRNGQPVPDSKG